MYRCEVCEAVSAPRQQQHRLTISRRVLRHKIVVPGPNGKPVQRVEPCDRQEIDREVVLCSGCHRAHQNGATLAQLQADHARRVRATQPTPEPVRVEAIEVRPYTTKPVRLS